MELDIRRIREEKGLTQEELAKKISYTPQAISKWECGKAKPNAELLPRIAEALNCDISDLYVYGIEDANRPAFLLDAERDRLFSISPELSEDERQLVAAYRQADDRTRQMVDLALEPYKPPASSSEAM